MADYWKSNPRKFCDFCKCWFADNKPSIEFHERGKRHKEAVEARLSEIGRKGREQYLQDQTLQFDLQKIEKAAERAFKKDLASSAALSNKQESSTETSTSATIEHKVHCEQQLKPDCNSLLSKHDDCEESQWQEAKTDEGYTYYWHIYTGESQWEVPENFTVPKKRQRLESNNPVEDSLDDKCLGVSQTQELEPTQNKECGSQELSSCDSEASGSKLYDGKPKVIFRQKTVHSLGSGLEAFRKRKLKPLARQNVE